MRVVTYWDHGDGKRAYQYRVSVSRDGQQWDTVADRSDNDKPATAAGELLSFAPRRARHVRIEMLRNSANIGVHLVEVMVFAAVEAPLADAPTESRPAWTAEDQTGSKATDMPNWGYVGAQRIVLRGDAVRVSGDRVRLVFRGGAQGSITIGDVSIGATDPADPANVKTGTRTPVTFGGANSVELGPGQEVASDWVRFPLEAGKDHTVTLDVERRGATTLWSDAKTVRFEGPTEAARMPRWSSVSHTTTHNLYFLSRIDVPK